MFRATLFIANRFTHASSLDAASGLFTETINCRHPVQTGETYEQPPFFRPGHYFGIDWYSNDPCNGPGDYLAQAVVCQEIVDRMPVGAGDVIPAGADRVFCFTQIDGIHEAAEITHNWYYQGSLLELFTLSGLR